MRKILLGLLLMIGASSVNGAFLDYTGYRLWNTSTNSGHWERDYAWYADRYDTSTGCSNLEEYCVTHWASTGQTLDFLLSLTGGALSGPGVAVLWPMVDTSCCDEFTRIRASYTRDGFLLTTFNLTNSTPHTAVNGHIATAQIPGPGQNDITFGAWFYMEVSEPSGLALAFCAALLWMLGRRRKGGRKPTQWCESDGGKGDS